MTNIDKKVEELFRKQTRELKPRIRDKAADVVSKFGGSWTFIVLFVIFFASWILYNSFIHAFDEYPFILLNLILSCLAVFQAPFILMSQNRVADIDRKRDEKEYKIDLKNQLEIIEIQKKLDFILKKLEDFPAIPK